MTTMLNTDQIIAMFEGLRRGQTQGRYAPHKPLLVLFALARIQHGQPRLLSFNELDQPMQDLLAEFGPTGSWKSRHYPYWHLDRGLWQVNGPTTLLNRSLGATPNLTELRAEGVMAGFAASVDAALRSNPDLLVEVAQRVLRSYFPTTLHADIAETIGLDLTLFPSKLQDSASLTYTSDIRRSRSRGFRSQVLQAYEYRCCICGFDLRISHIPAGLEAAHIQWHTAGGPDVVSNGLSLCALHHKLFDLGAFTLEPNSLQVLFSAHAISGGRGLDGELKHHGQPMLRPQSLEQIPSAEFISWNRRNVFKSPARA